MPNLPPNNASESDVRRSAGVLRHDLREARRHLVWRAWVDSFVQACFIGLPAAALAVAVDQRWLNGQWTPLILLLTTAALSAAGGIQALRHRRSDLGSAWAIDQYAHLKSRVSSAYEFLKHGQLSVPERVQVRDALTHVHRLDLRDVLEWRPPPRVYALPFLLGLVTFALFVPPSPASIPVPAMDEERQAIEQAALEELQEDLERALEDIPEDEELTEELEQLKEKVEAGEATPRDVMIGLSRLDAKLAEQLEANDASEWMDEAQDLAPHLSAAELSKAAGEAMSRDEMKKAAEELQRMTREMRRGEGSEEQRKGLQRRMEMAAGEMSENARQRRGQLSEESLSRDAERAANALSQGDMDEFSGAMREMSGKLRAADQQQQMMNARQRLAQARADMSQRQAQQRMARGQQQGQQPGQQGEMPGQMPGQLQNANSEDPGGLQAGTQADPGGTGEESRLEEAYRNVLRASAQANEGETQTRVEQTGGQLSESALNVEDLYAEYAAVAEAALREESIPLTQRMHVRDYFKAIRPSAEDDALPFEQ